jgi:hypothetical protein
MLSPPSTARAERALFALAICASAFLIFLIQPMVAKRVLPWYGGAPAVWTLCLAFYQSTLFLGYAYAHLLIRCVPAGAQLGVHALAIGSALLLLPVLPAESWQPDAFTSPRLGILALLAANVALPFFVLASSGPLLQAWFARRHPAGSPYPLYAVSNVGSLSASSRRRSRCSAVPHSPAAAPSRRAAHAPMAQSRRDPGACTPRSGSGSPDARSRC